MSALAQSESLAVVFPDDGAHKRFHSMFTDTPFIVCHKIRDGKKRIVKVKDGKILTTEYSNRRKYKLNLLTGHFVYQEIEKIENICQNLAWYLFCLDTEKHLKHTQKNKNNKNFNILVLIVCFNKVNFKNNK